MNTYVVMRAGGETGTTIDADHFMVDPSGTLYLFKGDIIVSAHNGWEDIVLTYDDREVSE
jgi:hypothetical protein